jgi:nucleotide-binding universal stress UspA family protein
MEIKKLLYVTKFEQLCFEALQTMLNLRRAHLQHVIFVTVIERERVFLNRGGKLRDEEIRLREKANIRFIDWAEDLFEQGMEVGAHILVGSLVPQVIKAVRQEEADLIVIGRSPKGVMEQLYSGSDVIELLRRAATPVLVYKHDSEPAAHPAIPFESPLLAMDWSPASLRAAECLMELGQVIRQVHLAYVASESDLSGASNLEAQKTRKHKRQALESLIEAFAARGIAADSHIYVGEPEEELGKAARECQASMIVLGSSSKNAWIERWVGSLPRSLAERSAYPTLIVPPAPTGSGER